MCGINGFNWKDEDRIRRMNSVIKHRGPDDDGVFLDDNASLGHVRLSIIDLSEKAHQPMKYKYNNKTIWITYNGEIYNYWELRNELIKKGHIFKSSSDTEVILAAYSEWGEKAVNKFNGMWAFAIYDPQRKVIFLSRDRLGIKPLYYYFDGEKFIFSSEIKGIFEHDVCVKLRDETIIEYLMFRSSLDEKTFYEEIFRVLPGENLVFDLKNGTLKKYKYWDLPTTGKYLDMDEKTALDKLDYLLSKSIKRRMIADVQVGSILSGGLDSSISTSYMIKRNKNLNTFTVRFKSESFDEGEYAKNVAEFLGTNHHELFLEFDDFIKGMEEYASLKDEPIGVPNEIALYMLSKLIRENKVYVVLSGEGSDEIFYGYNRIFRSPFDLERMRIMYLNKQNDKIPEDLSQKYKGVIFYSLLDLFFYNYPYWKENEIQKIVSDKKLFENVKKNVKFKLSEVLEKIAHDDYHRLSGLFIKIHLPILLNRVDNSTMMNAVESRVPFLDYKLVEFVFNLPNYLKNPFKSLHDFEEAIKESCDEIAENRDIPKYILKQLARGKIPEEIITRKKVGFPVPFVEWKEKLIKYAEKMILSDNSKILKYFDKENLKTFIYETKHSSNNYDIQKIWMLTSLELWLRKWGEKICKQ